MKIYKNYISLFILSIAVVLFSSCGENHTENDGHEHEAHSEDDGHGHGTNSEDDAHQHGEEHEEDGIHLTKTQIKTIGLELGDFSKMKVNGFVKANGVLSLPANSFIAISVKSNGIISELKDYSEGDFIKKGTVVAYLENSDFIIKQQEYLESKALLKLKKADLERQQQLMEQNAGVAKFLQEAQAQSDILEAKTTGIAKQLNYWGFSVKNLTAKTIKSKVSIVAPQDGYITFIKAHNGMYAQPNTSIIDLISTDNMRLELNVYEKNIVNLADNQKISYTIPAYGNQNFEANLSSIGKIFDPKTKTVRVYAKLNDKKPTFMKDLYVNAKIWNDDLTVSALPEKSVIIDGGTSFIYVAKENLEAKETQFKQLMVVPGATNNGYTAVSLIDKMPTNMKVVVEGAYYVYAQSKAGQLEHEH